ncbi:MAG: RluA family pseudouridine synthase [Bacteroidaceae bacterium]|nr:RluA family pseudouridine synthase [Bacteroidaceae bacterium]
MRRYLHPLPEETSSIESPDKFTYPFCYTPHPLCVAAVNDFKSSLKQTFPSLETSGKMFGVLVVEIPEGRAYLAAFSGILEGCYHHPGFVPPILDLQDKNGHFFKEETEISEINQKIKTLDSERDAEEITALKYERRKRSIALQHWTFEHFLMLNAKKEQKDLLEIFRDYKSPLTVEQYKLRLKPTIGVPPGGAGECCAPKLLQFAYKEGMKPLCMAEFWMGPSPKDEIREEGNYYPACNSKCKPILSHMLQGLDVEENPMIARNKSVASQLKVIYEDSDLAVIYKPSGMLSVPGKDDDVPSVLLTAQELFPHAEGPIIVHRLDMDTSGLMVLALKESSYKNLQQQFIRHDTQKKYIAILEYKEHLLRIPQEGTIDLPLCPNAFDRPRQMVSHEHGKRSITRYKILGKCDKGVKVAFWPETGRTHQLRVHSVHPDGLGSPILGDNLYGHPSDRLYLHAEELHFSHPSTNEMLHFSYPSI